MIKRIMTSIIAFPILAAFVVVGKTPLQLALMVLSVLGMTEIYKALSSKHLPIHWVGYTFSVIYFLALSDFNSTSLLITCAFFLIAVLAFLIVYHQKVNVIDCAVTVFGFYYISVLMSFVFLVRGHDYGQFFVWLIFISAWGCDTGAYFTGMLFGKHKLAPILSPKKTVEGAIGGVVFAALIAFLYSFTITKFFNISGDINIIAMCTVIGAAGSIFAQFGDLAASAIKRYTKIKDFGKIIPGHGGIIDRFDSILFTAPGVFIVMYLLVRVSTAQ